MNKNIDADIISFANVSQNTVKCPFINNSVQQDSCLVFPAF